MSESPKALVIDDEPPQRAFLVRALSRPDPELVRYYGCGPFETQVATCGREAEDYLEASDYDLVFLDLYLPPEIGVGEDVAVGKRLLTKVPKPPRTATIAITVHPSIATAVDVLRGGAVDFVDRLLGPDAKEIFSRAVSAYQRLCHQRRDLWHRAGKSRNALREACLLRSVSDEFTRAAGEVLSGVATSSEALKVLLRSRLGIDPKEINRDEIAGELAKIDQSVGEGMKKIRDLRDAAPIELDRTPITLSRLQDELCEDVETLAATRHLRIHWQVEADDRRYGLYLKDLRDTALELLHCAVQHAELDTTLQVDASGDRDRNTLTLAVGFQRSDRPMAGIDAADIAVYRVEEDTLPLVRGLVNRMGGQVRTRRDKAGLYIIELEIPVEL